MSCFDSLSPAKVNKFPNSFIKLKSLGYKIVLDSQIRKRNRREIFILPEGLEVKTIDWYMYYRDTISRIYIRIVREKSRTENQEEFIRYLKPFVSENDSFYSITTKNDKLIGLYKHTLFDKGIFVLSQRMFN